MRDINLMAATMRCTRDRGGGIAHRLRARPHAFVWSAGSSALNGQAVSYLIAASRVSNPAGTDRAHIVAWPQFADDISALKESAKG